MISTAFLRNAGIIVLVSYISMAGAFAPSLTPMLRTSVSQKCAMKTGRPIAVTKSCRQAGQALRMSSNSMAEDVKSELMSQLSAGTVGLKMQEGDDRNKINELLISLEPKNPTPRPAESSLLNGVWEMLYNGGYSPGFVDSPTREIALLLYTGGYRPQLLTNLMSKFMPGKSSPFLELDDLTLTIQRNAPRIEASGKVRLFSTEQNLKLICDLVVESGVRIRENFLKAEGFGQTTDLFGPLKLSRTLFITYLDEDIMVARDETGVPDIWIRKTKDFWSEDSEKIEPMPATSSTITSNPSVSTSSAVEPEWTNDEPDDIGPSDY